MIVEAKTVTRDSGAYNKSIDNQPVIVTPPWWLKWPTLIVNTDLYIVDRGRRETNRVEAAQVLDAARPMLQTIAREFERAGCSTVIVSKEREECETVIGSHHNPAYSITVNPVQFGVLPKEVETALENYKPYIDDKELLKTLKNHLPEETTPLLSGIGNRLLRWVARFHKKANKDKPKEEQQPLPLQAHEEGKNFVNMIFVRDDKGIIAASPDRALQLLNWAFMIKEGAYKEGVVTYTTKDGKIEFRNPILATLEGGHPLLDTIGLAQHLMVFGSVKSVGDAEEIPDVDPISRKLWRNSPTVNGLRNFGKFLGSRDLLSPPLALHQFARNRSLREELKKIAKFSRQAEGAFWAWAADNKLAESISQQIQSPLNGVAIVTSSGKFGAVKSKLGFKDLVTSIPATVLGITEAAKILYLRVKGHTIRKPSVEAEEFTFPVYELAEEDPEIYTIKLKAVEGGYLESSDGDLVAPIVKGVGHLHDEMTIKDGVSVKYDELGEDEIIVNEEAGIFEIPTDAFPAFGCGVDQMQEMSRRVMKQAINIWIKRGRKDKAAIFYVPNHGYNIITFWVAEKNGIIPADSFIQLEEIIENGDLIVKKGVHQRNYYRPLDDYYDRCAKKAA